MKPDPELPADYVLLVNSKIDKGYGLIMDVAALRPEINFVCISSQSNGGEARTAAAERNLSNIHVLPRTDDMDRLYRHAKVVAVPSYIFIETFSRVCIEAHRYGKPVLGSTSGNVPYLLEKSGFVLPEDAQEWASLLDRLYGEPEVYAAAVEAALENSRRYSYASQRESILSVARQAESPMLIAIGSGIGNMIHVAPMIRRIAEHLGHSVDLLVAEDHSDSLFLLQNSQYVNAVYSLRQYALARRYDTIFVTHCFGAARLPLKAKRVIWTRDWDDFKPDHRFHEARFNLEAARELLGVPYEESDILGYYIGDLDYSWPAGKLVGFHGGSKDGFWVSKRWPYYSALAARLQKKGYRVASFGTEGEYVEGTENMTGGSIQEMAEKMRACSYFVSNDSGVMNIANALGIPLIAIFGPTNVRTRGPLRPTSQGVSLMKDCSPCECKDTAVFLSAQCRCIGEVPLDEVTQVFDALATRMTAETTPSPPKRPRKPAAPRTAQTAKAPGATKAPKAAAASKTPKAAAAPKTPKAAAAP
jgi:ADP-heptose:LPS heptosyltransferase